MVQPMANDQTKKRIAVVTGSRAEFGLLSSLMQALHKSNDFHLLTVVTGQHLDAAFGSTFEEIEKAGFEIDAKVPVLDGQDDFPAMARAVGRGVIGMSEALTRLAPDLVVVLGDRFEIYAAATASALLKIPLAHIHGGEVTEGAIDESLRHAITKLAHLHFVSANEYGQRVRQLGENPKFIFTVGAPGLDLMEKTQWLNAEELSQSFPFQLGKKVFLVTHHPETLGDLQVEKEFQEITAALDEFPEAQIVWTLSNADPGGRKISQLASKYARQNPTRVAAVASLGSRRYLSLMKLSQLVVGNSSSGIIEAPALKVPTINIGDRQRGRLRAKSVLNTNPIAREISKTMREGLALSENKNSCVFDSPYGTPGVAEKILSHLRKLAADWKSLIRKPFFDL